MNIPNELQCEALWNEANTPPRVRRHCYAVMLRACALLEELPEGWNFNEDLIVAGALLHDLLRTLPLHELRGAEYLEARGYPEVARLVREHMYFTEDMRLHPDERAVVFLADKLVIEDGNCSIAARYAAALLKGAPPEEMEKETLRAQALYETLRAGPRA